ncbi:hypothetical protein [Azorhizobium doebereinerae]|uniref:hypothetical protein n=1 Tax=Azorhizobium doebereinerae TaxID=281091 RepID=UPI00048E34A8|nr:hypothetical protein [Azorhizobium doebereinerae]
MADHPPERLRAMPRHVAGGESAGPTARARRRPQAAGLEAEGPKINIDMFDIIDNSPKASSAT